MQDACAPFRNKKITVLGLGLLGRGVGDAEFLAKCGADVLVTDKKNESELAESVEKLRQYPNVSFKLGGHDKKDFTDCDLIIKAAGVPLNSPEIAAAREAGVPVAMSTALFAKYAAEAGARLIGVTGTRGKTTVAHMIYHALRSAGKQTLLGGNIRGVSTLAMLPEVKNGQLIVLELDSWQLQGFGDIALSPHIAIFTNLFPDHLDYYPDMGSYFSDKCNIFKYQKAGDTLIAGKQIADKILAESPPVTPTKPSQEHSWNLKVIGSHNEENAALAAAALKAAGLSDSEIKVGLESFEPVEGRLQFIREARGVKIYNDNNATTPDATIAGLRAVGNIQKRNVVLIMGGDDKKLDMTALVEEIPKWCSKVVLFKERGTDTVRDAIFEMKESRIGVYEEEGLHATVERAFAVAEPGETILYSPAFSSFGKYFKNEFDRGDQFLRIANKHI